MHTHRPQFGIVLVTFAISALSLMLFLGLVVDVGFLYMSRAALSKGVDAAALMGVRNLSAGEATAQQLAINTFNLNYDASGMPARQAEAPTVTVTFPTSGGMKTVKVVATVRIKTYLVRLIPGLDKITTGSIAQASRARLVLGMVLDRSGSMLDNGGAAALPGAAGAFIDYFDNTSDQAGLASYSDGATLDVAMGPNFKTPIHSKINTLHFGGWTFAHGGIDISRTQINGATVPAGENVLRVMVFFTDGQANSFKASTECKKNKFQDLVLVPGSATDDFRDPSTGATVTCTANTTQTFFAQHRVPPGNMTRNSANVEDEGLYRAEQSAALVRGDKTLVFAIGLGNDINRSSLLCMANDPACAHFNAAQPIGAAVFAPTSAQLQDAFRQIAAKILLRLVQ